MKKILRITLTSIVLLSTISIANADLTLSTEQIDDNNIKVLVNSANEELLSNAWFTLWFDPSLTLKEAKNWNLLTSWTPIQWEGTLSFFWEWTKKWLNNWYWVLAEFILEKPIDSDIVYSTVELINGSSNGVEQKSNTINLTFPENNTTVETNTKIEEQPIISAEDTQTKTWSEWMSWLIMSIIMLLWLWFIWLRKNA